MEFILKDMYSGIEAGYNDGELINDYLYLKSLDNYISPENIPLTEEHEMAVINFQSELATESQKLFSEFCEFCQDKEKECELRHFTTNLVDNKLYCNMTKPIFLFNKNTQEVSEQYQLIFRQPRVADKRGLNKFSINYYYEIMYKCLIGNHLTREEFQTADLLNISKCQEGFRESFL